MTFEDMPLYLKELKLNEYELIRGLYAEYLEEMSEYFVAERDVHGEIEYDSQQILKYWERRDHWSYAVVFGGEICGFCLLRKYPEEKTTYDIEQFYIKESHRRRGIGRQALYCLLSKYPGSWQIRIIPNNVPAIKFWKDAIESYLLKEIKLKEADEYGDKMLFLKFKTKN